MTTAHFNVLDPYLTEALRVLADPALTVCRNISRGHVSGKFDLHNAVFPPNNIHRNELPYRVTFEMETGVFVQLSLMTLLYADPMSGPYSLLGLISHDMHQEMRSVISFPDDYRMEFIGVNYNPVIREGKIYIPKETYRVLEVLESREILRYRMKKQIEAGVRLSE